MYKNFVCPVMLGLLATAGGFVSSAAAQDAVMDEFYGNGVHNFYDRDFFQAMQNLSIAIDGGSKDPRAYYYRGLARLRTGDTWGAHDDMQHGAHLEADDVDQFYPVAKSLERVQGADRKQLEKYRSIARAKARQRQRHRDALRYEQRRRDEAQVLRAVPVGPQPAPLVAPASGVAPAPAVAAPAAPAVVPPPAPAPAAVDDPFAPAADAPADTGNPFGDAPSDAPAEMPADAPAEDSPFGDAAGEAPADDPFSAPADETPADENPFGDDPN